MATNPNYLFSQPVQTVDPNGPYAQGLAFAQGQQQPQMSAPPPDQSQMAPSPSNAAPAAPAPQAPPSDPSALPPGQAPHHGGIFNALGRANDYLMALAGFQPTFQPWQRANDARQAEAAWLQNPNDKQAQANYLATDPSNAFNNMQTLRSNQLSALKTGLEIQQQQRANAQAALGNVTNILKRVRDGKGDVGAAFDQLANGGYLDAIGMHPAEAAQWRSAIVANPGIIDALAPPPESVVLPGGEGAPSTLVNKITGAAIATGARGPIKYGVDDNVLLPDGSNAGGGGAPNAAPGSPSIVAGNNAGALKDGAFARSQPGYAGADANGFATFKSPGQGIAAQETLLRTAYLGKGVNTVNGIVDKYLGAGDRENSPQSRANYKAYVASQLGVAPDAPISGQQLRPLAAAMRNFETGQTGSSTPVTAPGSITRGATAPTAESPNTPGYTLAVSANGKLSPEARDQAATQYILTGVMPPNIGRGGVRQTEIVNRATELSKNLSPGQIGAIRASYDADVKSLGTLENQATIVRAAEGAATKNADLALSKAGDVTNGNVQVFNAWRNAANRHTGDPKIAALDTAITTFVNQYATVMGGGTPTEGLRHEGAELINGAQSPKQLQSVIGTMKQDMANKRSSFADERRQTQSRIEGALPVSVQSPADVAKLPPNTRFVTPDGRLGTSHGRG